MECHRKVTRDPVSLVLYVNYIPYVFLNVVALANVSDFFGGELNTPTKHIDKLSVKNAASCRVSCDVQICHPDPLVLANIVVLTGLIKVFGVVASNHIDTVLLLFIDRSEI